MCVTTFSLVIMEVEGVLSNVLESVKEVVVITEVVPSINKDICMVPRVFEALGDFEDVSMLTFWVQEGSGCP